MRNFYILGFEDRDNLCMCSLWFYVERAPGRALLATVPQTLLSWAKLGKKYKNIFPHWVPAPCHIGEGHNLETTWAWKDIILLK